jgi:hypothetical protein
MRSHDEDNDVITHVRDHVPTVDNYSRLMGSLDGLPDVIQTRPTPHQHIPQFGIGGVEMFTVQTFRQREVGDTIFLMHSSSSGTIRLVIPPKVAEIIARQHDQVGKTNRKKQAKRVAQERMDAGIMPGFMKKRA